MGLGLLDVDSVVPLLAGKLAQDWILAIGDLDIMGIIEQNVYLPPFGNNADFEVIQTMTKAHGFVWIHILRKTAKLRQFMDERFGMGVISSEKDWKSLHAIMFKKVAVADQKHAYQAQALKYKAGTTHEMAVRDVLKTLGMLE
jgi:hypothetical protein